MSRRDVRSLLASGCTITVVTLLALSAFGDDVPPKVPNSDTDSVSNTMTVEMRVVGTEADLLALEQALGSQRLGTAKLSWSSASSFDPHEVLRISRGTKPHAESRTVRCWIDLSDRGTARLYFVDPTKDRFMLRELELGRRWASFEVESIAQIVELSVSALVSDDAAGMSRSEAQQVLAIRPGPEPPDATSERKNLGVSPHYEAPRYAIAMAGFYGIRSYSAELPLVTGPGVCAAVTRAVDAHLDQLELSAGYEFPRSFEVPLGGASLSTWVLRLRAERLFPIRRAARLWLGVNIAAGFDIVGATPTKGSASGNYELAGLRRDYPFVFAPGADWLVELSDYFALRLLVSLDVTPKPVQHSMLVHGATQVLTEARYLRPSASLGVVFR